MRAYKFDATVSSNGTIKIPYTPALMDKDVEIIIVPKTKFKKVENSGRQFVKKWAGFISTKDMDASKYDYLSKKYK